MPEHEQIQLNVDMWNLGRRHRTRDIRCIIVGGRLIMILESQRPRAFCAALDAWTTCLMNFISPEHAVVAFPFLTFDYRTMCHGPTELHSVSADTQAKYTARSFSTLPAPPVGRQGDNCVSLWMDLSESAAVCVLPMHVSSYGTVPFDMGGQLTWRCARGCHIRDCRFHKPVRGELRSLVSLPPC